MLTKKIIFVLSMIISVLLGCTAFYKNFTFNTKLNRLESHLLQKAIAQTSTIATTVDQTIKTINPTTISQFLSSYQSQSGYYFFTNHDGNILFYPDKNIAPGMTIASLAAKKNNTGLAHAANLIGQGNTSFTLTYNNELTNSPSWLIAQGLPSHSGILLRVINKEELRLFPHNINLQIDDEIRQTRFMVTLLYTVAALLFILAIACIISNTMYQLWIQSTAASVLLTIALIILWYTAYQHPSYKNFDFMIKNNEDIKQTITKYQIDKQFVIPTGIFVRSIHPISEYVAHIACYIWQRYDVANTQISPGIILPQMRSGDVIELYQKSDENHKTIVWQVNGEFNQTISYKNYPFDVKDLEIKIWHKELDQSVLLIPDLLSYQLIDTQSLPGINKTLEIDGWSLAGSYFKYKIIDYGTRFGIYQSDELTAQRVSQKFPELGFVIMTQRNLLDTVTTDLLPLVVIAMLLFVTLLTVAQQGFSVLAGSSAIFFGIVVSQMKFHEKIPAFYYVYFENFFLISYISTLLVIIISLFYLLNFNITFFTYKKDLFAQILFWPFNLLFLVAITAWSLY